MVSDFLKGRGRFGLSGKIQVGIALHRYIDEYTDTHPLIREAKEFFRPHYRLYSAPIVDIILDHFLANDSSIFTDDSLLRFSLNTYQHLDDHFGELPQNFRQAFFYMKRDNWLYRYHQPEGIGRSLQGLVHRSRYLTESDTAMSILMDNYVALRTLYQPFFSDVKQFAKEKLLALGGEPLTFE